MKMTWLHRHFVLIFVTGPSQAESGTHSLALTVKTVILKPLIKDYVRGGAKGALAPRNLGVQKGEQKEK